jgi:uncharacterized membrane protein YraQ (UPF0718 family)
MSSGKSTVAFSKMKIWNFPVVALVIYLALFLILPEKAVLAVKASGNTLLSMLLPLALVFLIMLLLNLFLKPVQIMKFLGKKASLKGLVTTIVAGIVSTGPIYAWYPLLKDLKEKGAGNHIIAVFLHNRAVKPFLLPVMVSYFGWLYVLILTALTVLGSIVIGYSINILVREKLDD